MLADATLSNPLMKFRQISLNEGCRRLDAKERPMHRVLGLDAQAGVLTLAKLMQCAIDDRD
ncbi:MAG: hypothetical protein ABIY37_08115 [Devosia sp.]